MRALVFGLLVIAASGCGDALCSRWARLYEQCEGNDYTQALRERCRDTVQNLCSTRDRDRLRAHLDCLQARAECGDGTIGAPGAAEACFAELSNTSPSCRLP